MCKVREYWDRRYEEGRTSGIGSYGTNADYKANFINNFITEKQITSIIDFGCGDGNQLGMINIKKYIGLDISKHAIKHCMHDYKDDDKKEFHIYSPGDYIPIKAEMGLSLDVIYHLVEDSLYKQYLIDLFESSEKYVIIYSSNKNEDSKSHVRHREFIKDVYGLQWKLLRYEKNKLGGDADFFIFERI